MKRAGLNLIALISAVPGLANAGTARAAAPWSSPASWQGAVPQEGEVVTIPSGTDILLDTDPPALGGLIIEGSLTFARKDLRLTSRWIVIAGGSLHIGSPDALHEDDALITLTGTDENGNVTAGGNHPVGTKCIGVTKGGRLELHGVRAGDRNWTQLAAHARRGAAELRVAEPVAWRSGDQIVIAPGGFDPLGAEEVTVTAVVSGVVHFAPPLRHDHFGELQVIGGHTIDERAEVACLTRTIVIQGDEDSALSDFGGHLMFHHDTTIHIEGVELRRMGQKGHAGRYPIHWHGAGDPPGDYARGNSIHHSYNRAIVTHGTSHVLVENNVTYDVWSHAFVPSEDGSETGNRYLDNLAILTRSVSYADFAFPDDSLQGSSQSEGRPGAFWMKAPENTLTGNHVAGVINGMGFFYDGPGSRRDWTGEFTNNTAHACSGPSDEPVDNYPPLTRGYGLFVANHRYPAGFGFQDFTAYKNTLSGMWLDAPGQRVQNATLADNGTAAVVSDGSIEDSVVVGQSANTTGALPAFGSSTAGGIFLASDDGLKSAQLCDIDFINQRDAAIVMRGTRLHPLSTVERLRFTNTPSCRIAYPANLDGGITDADGSLRGDGIPVYVHGNEPLAMTPESSFDAALNAWVTPLGGLTYLSLTDTRPAADELGFTVLVSDTEAGILTENQKPGQAPVCSGYVRNDTAYNVARFDPLPDGVRISAGNGAPGFVELAISFAGAARVYEEALSGLQTAVPDFGKPTVQAGSVGELSAGTSPAWYSDPPNDALHIRLRNGQTVYVFDAPAGGLDVSTPELLWRSQQFGYHTVRDAGAANLWGPLADPDGDGIRNRIEFFLGTSPLQAGSPLVFDPAMRRLSFPRNPAASDLSFVVSYSNDLTTWHSDAQIEQVPAPDGSIQVQATAPLLPANQSLFMVLKCAASGNNPPLNQ